jgi:hypothetical protein
MKKYIYLIIILFNFLHSKAQLTSIAIELIPDSAITGLSFTCSQVIDGRYNKNNIGYLYRGLGNKKIEAQLINEFAEHIFSTTEKLLPFSSEKTQLVLIFKDLRPLQKLANNFRAYFSTFFIVFSL